MSACSIPGFGLIPTLAFIFMIWIFAVAPRRLDCGSVLGRLRAPMPVGVNRFSRRLGRRACSDTSINGAIEPNVFAPLAMGPAGLFPYPPLRSFPLLSPSSPSPR